MHSTSCQLSYNWPDIRQPRLSPEDMSRQSNAARQGVDAQVLVQKPKARRKYAPKVRTGCITCGAV
ncbi:unnamed protein product [Clonostachys rosea]|uniref:Uncharacterized protein n=1 Tax=Bionectria ochroleuca TaxID=29856 RepID=A0ABY6UGE0_BIOOC|nr:unnamed protein product [Clonostachys rosea]